MNFISAINFDNQKLVDISCGHSFLLALTSEGNIYSFGVGQSGTLGHGQNVTVQLKPLKIVVPEQNQLRFSRIYAGENHCVALTMDNRVFSWGYGGDGRLGHGDCQSLFYPTLIVSFENTPIRDVSCGFVPLTQARLLIFYI
jgi:alpha-tubulin suppressor-like RCC1 family protein